jgi:hypothetical protein
MKFMYDIKVLWYMNRDAVCACLQFSYISDRYKTQTERSFRLLHSVHWVPLNWHIKDSTYLDRDKMLLKNR